MLYRISRPWKTAFRLAQGATRFVCQKADDNPRILSVDIFATILSRSADDDAAWRAGTLSVWQVIHRKGLAIPRHLDLIKLRRDVEAKLSAELINAGKDPEFSHHKSFEALLVSIGAGSWAASEATSLAAIELAYEAALTRPVQNVVAWIAEEAAKGRRVIAVSDTRYRAEEIRTLLQRHNVSGISKVYASADYQASKFHGKLFDVVLREEDVEAKGVLHCGDNLLSDCLAAAQRGCHVRKMPRLVQPACVSPLPVAPPAARHHVTDAFAVGYETIGPLLVAFTRLLLERAAQDGVGRLAFVARDGELLLSIAQIIAANRPGWNPTLSYLQLSRRAVACALQAVIRATESPAALDSLLKETSVMIGGSSQLDRVCKLFGLPLEQISAEAACMGMSGAKLTNSELRALFSDPRTAEVVRQCVAWQRQLLLRYLYKEQILSASTALVDVGWRGSTQRALEELSKSEGLCAPRAYYLGLWDEGRMVSPGGIAEGILCDQRRKWTLLESSAWQAAYLLESVCRAGHGMVIGFEEQDGGTVLPLHAKAGSTREAELRSESARQQVREGALEYARWFSGQAACAPPFSNELKLAAQRRLLRLAFFPRPEERALGRLLVHTEPTSDDWFAPLIMSPKGGVKGWLAGVRSPWKGGYFRDTGGLALAALYFLAEDSFVRLPPGSKFKIREILMRNTN